MKLDQISKFACYYGHNRLVDLTVFDLAVLQPTHYQAEELIFLRANGTLPIAYLSISEEPTTAVYSPWALIDSQTNELVKNTDWDTILVDCRSSIWQMHLLHQIIPDIVSTGFAGLFLDTIEIQDRYPEMRQSVVRLIQSIRKHYPDMLLIGNRGFSILDEIADSLDAILFEAFSSHYTNGQYQTWKNDEWAWTEHMAKLLQTIYGKCTILALDYADPEDLTLHSLAKERSQAFGFLSFVTTWKIDWLPETEVNS